MTTTNQQHDFDPDWVSPFWRTEQGKAILAKAKPAIPKEKRSTNLPYPDNPGR
jgi:hypothetical protein